MELSKLKLLQRYMTNSELEYRNFEQLPQRHKLSTTFKSKIEGFFETLYTADVDMSTDHSMIYPIVNRNFGDTFHNHNGPNQRQHIHKNTSHQYQSRSHQRPGTS